MKSISAVGRFLGVTRAEVRRLIREDGLPAKRLPGKKRPRTRVFLPDLWRWLCGMQGESEEMRNFATFEREFLAAQKKELVGGGEE